MGAISSGMGRNTFFYNKKGKHVDSWSTLFQSKGLDRLFILFCVSLVILFLAFYLSFTTSRQQRSVYLMTSPIGCDHS